MLNKLSNNSTFEILLLVISFIMLFTNTLPLIPLSIVLLPVILFRVGLSGSIFFLIIIAPLYYGRLLFLMDIPAGGIFQLMGIFLILFGLLCKKIELNDMRKGLYILSFFIVYLYITVLLTTGGDYANEKLILTIITSYLSFFAFVILFNQHSDAKFDRLALYLVSISVWLLILSPLVNGTNGPSSPFDFGFMRNGIDETSSDKNQYQIVYHLPGYVSLYGFSLLMFSKNIYFHKKTALFLLFVSILICLYSGARQFILISIMFLFIFLFFQRNKSKKNILNVFVPVLGVLLILYLVLNKVEIFDSVMEKGLIEGSGRSLLLIEGVNLFVSHPTWGVGYGRYVFMGEYGSYPHNIIIELLSEIGIVGTMLFFYIFIRSIVRAKTMLHFSIFILLLLFFRAFVSGGMDQNIVVLSIVLSLETIVANKHIVMDNPLFLKKYENN